MEPYLFDGGTRRAKDEEGLESHQDRGECQCTGGEIQGAVWLHREMTYQLPPAIRRFVRLVGVAERGSSGQWCLG